MNGEFCKLCGRQASAYHHIIYRSQNSSLIKCELNQIPVCTYCHTEIHSKNGAALNRKLKLEFQNKLEELWDKQYLTREEINNILQINEKALNRLLKRVCLQKDKYIKEDVIRTVMGGKLII